jgi:ADP-ribose pyrophosphatase YjhB (NUDIX family)
LSDEPVHANHRLQAQYPGNARFCPLCGSEMTPRVVLPDRIRHKVCPTCGFVHFPSPKLVAGCLVVDARGVLLLRRGIEPSLGKWTFPGGFVDFGESAADAALRETAEEVGMRVALGPVLGCFTDPGNPSVSVVVYLAAPGAEAASVSEEATEVRYFAASEIPWNDLAFRTTVDGIKAWIASRTE